MSKIIGGGTQPARQDAERNIEIAIKLVIIGEDKVVVPNCEPTSAITSVTLLKDQVNYCKNSVVSLADALLAIPGSTVEYGYNFGVPRQKWFVLPPNPVGCCGIGPDWYKVLRELPAQPPPVESKFDYCNVNGMGYCPSPGFLFADAPPTRTYEPEGTDILGQQYTQ